MSTATLVSLCAALLLYAQVLLGHGERLGTVATEGLDERIYVRGDKTASYGTIMRVLGIINGAGYRHIGLVALKEPDS